MLRNRTPYADRRPKEVDRKPRRAVMLLFAVLLLAGVVSALAYGGWRLAVRTSLFVVTNVSIEGLDRLGEEAIREAAGLDGRPVNLLAFASRRMAAAVVAHPWVQTATVDKRWPDGLVIRVQERKPIALVNLDGDLYYLDRGGEAFFRPEAGDDFDFPVISGLPAAAGHQLGDNAAVQAALQFLALAGKERMVLPEQNVSELLVRPGGGLVVFLADRPFPIFLGGDDMGGIYFRLSRVLYWLYKKNEFEDTAYIRLDLGSDRVLVGKVG
ncbi:MAG: FtsQ-type POTRA domain-containing protein [Thermodesulfobacteriota bacterium]